MNYAWIPSTSTFVAEIREHTKESFRLDKLIGANLEDIGHGA